METEQQASTTEFPDNLVAKIISMVPFPYIAKFRGVSKIWRTRFSASASLDDETKRNEAVAFQRQVQERAATNWSTYFPVCAEHDFMCGFERESQKWVRFPCLSFLPSVVFTIVFRWWIEGALLYGESRREGAVYVVNLVTRLWKKSATLTPSTSLHNALSVWDASSGTYKVISLQADPTTFGQDWSAQIYNAKSDVWYPTAIRNPDIASFGIPVHLNGVVYEGSSQTRLLHAFNVADETVSTIELSCLAEFKMIYLVVCDGKLYMIHTDIKFEEPLCVLEVDLQSLRLLEVATAPITLTQGGSVVEICTWRPPVTDGSNCIFFFTVMPGYPGRLLPGIPLPGTMVAYDIHTHQWTVLDFLSMMSETLKISHIYDLRMPRVFDWLPSSFQPGLNPFAEV